MCRLLGVVAAQAAPIVELVPDELPRLEALATRCEALDAFMKARPSPDELMPAKG